MNPKKESDKGDVCLMYNYLKAITARLTKNDERQLRDIYKPTVVAVPDADPVRGLCVTRDGRIRFYGEYNRKHLFDNEYERCYIESADGGLSWKKYIVENENTLGASSYVPFCDKYISVFSNSQDGLFLLVGDSPDDENPVKMQISKTHYPYPNRPFFVNSKKRIIVLSHELRSELHSTARFTVVFVSDDIGKTWKEIKMPPAPFHEKKWPDKGYRWQQNSRENAIEELCDGRLMMIARTATDYHYVSYSEDFGDTWTKWQPSVFHSTGTMSNLKKLSDGRILFFWCNTKLLPEIDGADGVWEDVFTNRDVNHVAITENDGKTWLGYREMYLNPIRNAADFRANGGPKEADKSTQQFEVLELPMGKILVVCGQHYASRRILIFDINWLYEKKRKEDFLYGFANISTHSYIKSILGGRRVSPDNPLGYVGHCAYNRINSAIMVKSGDNPWKEELLITRFDDDRLVSNRGGAVWNFPIAQKGRVKVSAHIEGKGLRLSLLDYWMNPCDETVEYFADFSFVVRKDMMNEENYYTEVVLEFDCKKNTVKISASDMELEYKMIGAHPNGICYLHMQSAATEADPAGASISEIEFESLD